MNTFQAIEGSEHHPYEAEARQRWGDDAVNNAAARISDWTSHDAERARTGYRTVHEGLAGMLTDGVAVGDTRVQELVDQHFQVTSLFWTPTRETYLGLAQTYRDDERFRQNIGGGNPALVTYLCQAMAVFAHTRLD